MVTLQAVSAQETFIKDEDTYETQFLKWNGLVNDLSLIGSIVDMRAGSVAASYKVTADQTARVKKINKMFDSMDGRGNESFRLIMANMYKIAYVCGDAYAEKVRDKSGNIVNLEVLPSDNIRQVIKNGSIIRFEEIDAGTGNLGVSWKPEDILHLAYNKLGAMTHGRSKVESMQNVLISYKQMLQTMTEIWENTVKPREIIYTNTDNAAKNKTIADAFNDSDKTFRGKIFLPAGLVTKYEVKTVVPGIDPEKSVKAYRTEIYLATQTSEILLGSGYSTSEEDARLRTAGYSASIRTDQEWLEEIVIQQILKEIYPEGTPKIKFSFATEPEDEKFKRQLDAATSISGHAIPDEVKATLIGERYAEAGVLEE